MLKNIPWNFSPRTVTLLAGKREIFLDAYPWPFSPSREDTGDFFLPGPESLASVFSPLMTLSHGTLTGPRGSAPAGADGFSSAEELACVVRATMGLEMMRLGDRLVFSREGLSGDLPGSGDSRIRKGLFWFDEGQRLVPYQLIVPRGASPDALVVLLHGGGGNPDSCPKDFRGTLPEYAERFSCVLLCPDAVVKNSTYGCPVPPQGIDPQARGMFPNTPPGSLRSGSCRGSAAGAAAPGAGGIRNPPGSGFPGGEFHGWYGLLPFRRPASGYYPGHRSGGSRAGDRFL